MKSEFELDIFKAESKISSCYLNSKFQYWFWWITIHQCECENFSLKSKTWDEIEWFANTTQRITICFVVECKEEQEKA